jgi:hypothetical protein
MVGHLLGAGYLRPWRISHELDRFEQRFMGAGVEPRTTAAQLLDAELVFEINIVGFCDLELGAR